MASIGQQKTNLFELNIFFLIKMEEDFLQQTFNT